MQQLHDLQWYKDCTSLTSTCKVALWLTGLWDQLSDRIFSRPSFSKRCWKKKKKKKNQIKQTGFQLFWFDQTLNDSSHIRPHISDAKPDSSSFKSETDFGKCSENKPFIMAAHCAPPHCDYLAGVVQLKKLEISGSDLPEATRLHRNWGQFKSKRDSNWYYIKNNIDWLHHSDHQHLSSLKGRSWQQPISTQLNDTSPFHWLISVR